MIAENADFWFTALNYWKELKVSSGTSTNTVNKHIQGHLKRLCYAAHTYIHTTSDRSK